MLRTMAELYASKQRGPFERSALQAAFIEGAAAGIMTYEVFVEVAKEVIGRDRGKAEKTNVQTDS